MSHNPYQTPGPDEIVPAIVGSPDADRSAKRKIVIALTCLHISALLYVVLGGLFCALFASVPPNEGTQEQRAVAAFIGVVILAMCLAMALIVEVVALGVHKRKFWGWIGSVILFGLYAPSIFFPLGIVGLWAMLTGDTQQHFKQNRWQQPPQYPGHY